MFADKIPMDILQNMLKVAREESSLNYSKVLQTAGKELTPEVMQSIDMCADIAQLYFFSMIKQLDIAEATLKATQKG